MTNMCRCCLSKQNLCNIYSIRSKKTQVPYIDMIRECLSINACDTDGLPTWICVKCSNKLNSFYKFKLKSLKTHSTLLEDHKEIKEADIKLEKDDIDKNEYSDLEILVDDADDDDDDVNVKFGQLKYDVVYDSPFAIEDFIINNNGREDVETKAVRPVDIDILKNEDENLEDNIQKEEIKLEEDLVKNKDGTGNKEADLILSQIDKQQKICPLCQKFCHNNNLLLDHVKYVHYHIKYYCDICQKYFNAEYSHKKLHLQKKWKQCDDCGESFTHKSSYVHHMLRAHGRKGGYVCACGQSFDKKVMFKRHKLLEHNEKSFFCHLCQASYTRKQKLDQHVQRHLENKVIRPRITRTADVKIQKPLDNVPLVGDKGRKCTICNKVCSSNLWLQEHIRMRHLGDKFFCNICKKYYQSEIRHNRYAHRKPYWRECQPCRIKFQLKTLYEAHMAGVHSYVQPKVFRHTCPCGENFDNIQIFRKHKFKMHNECDFVCHYCSKGYWKKDKLTQHMLIHTKEVRFPCHVCEKTFCSREGLRRHKYFHNRDQGNYICDHCGKDFSTKSYLRSHITSHDPAKKLHVCAVCHKAFRRSDHKNNHQRMVHKLDMDIRGAI